MELIQLRTEYLSAFKIEVQEAFQQGYEAYFGPCNERVLPLSDIEMSLAESRAEAYEVIDGGERLGGCILTTSQEGDEGELLCLYTKVGHQNKGVATFLWGTIEQRYPNVKRWTTLTPYFDKRNIHFYVNRCGFRIIEFFNEKNPEPTMDNCPEDYNSPIVNCEFFKFEKVINEATERT